MKNNTQIWFWLWVKNWINSSRMVYIAWTFLAGLVVFSSCSGLKHTPASSSVRQPLNLYNPTHNELHPDLVIHHSGIDESTLYFRLLSSELLFNQANPETKDQSRVTLSYQLFSNYADQTVDQRGVKQFVINKEAIQDQYIGSVKIPTEEGKSYLLEVEISDDIRQVSSRKMILVDRFNPKSQQNFLLVNYPGNEVAFERFFYANETFRVVSQDPPGNRMRVAYYRPIRQIPAPPFADQVTRDTIAEPDSLWMIQTNGQSIYRLENEGIYLLYPDAQKMAGAYVTNFGRSFPRVRLAVQMIPPLEYIATPQQYAVLQETDDPKQAVDEFWLEKAGSFTAARELIRVYYNRVVLSNLYFSTDRPGWMTDRGMIYLMMGPPNLVNKTESGESWVYKLANSNQKYTFEFYLAPDPVMGYEFRLKRTEDHRVPWNMALQSWRDGRIYTLQ